MTIGVERVIAAAAGLAAAGLGAFLVAGCAPGDPAAASAAAPGHGAAAPGHGAAAPGHGAAAAGAGTADPGGRPAASAPAPGHGAAAGAAPRADPLSGAAARYAAGRSGQLLAAVYDVRTGQSWQLGTGKPQAEASIVKLDILEALLARQHGTTTLSPADQQLAQAMIEDSDNDAATSLWDAAGGATGLSAYNGSAGLTGTTPSQCVECAGFPWPGWGLTTTVPRDQLSLLRQLVVPGQQALLPAAARAYVLALMKNVTPDQRWGVSAGVPSGVTVALKNGWLPLNGADTDWQINSVGWVSGDGRDYLIAVLSTGSPSEQYGIDTVSGVSARVWSGLATASPAGNG